MKSVKLFFAVLFMTSMFSTVHAQNPNTKAEVIQMFNEVCNAFTNGQDAKGWGYYTETATEIGPDGNITSGKAALKASWDGFMKMVDSRPTFTYANPAVQVLSPNVAVVTFDSEADIKIKGQQVGGKTKGIAVVHKINGKWYIEADAITPVMPMPALDATSSVKNTYDADIQAVYDNAKKALNTGNVAALVDLFAENATHVTPLGTIVKGKEALTQNYIALFKMFAQMPKPDSRTTEVLDMTGQYLNPDLFLTTYREKNTSVFGSKTQVEEMACSVLLAKKNGKWLIENLTLTPKSEMPSAVAKN